MTIVALKAISVGYLAATRRPDVAHVHSCFTHAVNLIADDGHLFTLLNANSYQNLPDAIRINLPENWDWRQHTAPSESVQLISGKLQASRWLVDTGSATLWQPRLSGSSLSLNALPEALGHYETLASQLLLYCLEHRLESDLRWANCPPSANENKLCLIPEEEMEPLEGQVIKLIGYGRGLTPDGDDYLLGYLAALWIWQLTPRLLEHQNRMQWLIREYLPRTTDISLHYLNRALEGHFSQPVCELLEQITAQTQTAAVANAAEQVMQFGASSGVDCLAGILHGLRTIKAAV